MSTEKFTLYDIDCAYQSAQDRADEYAAEHNGEMLPEHDMALTALEMTRDLKIENTIKFIKNQKAIAEMIDKEIETLQNRSKNHWNSANRNKDYLSMIINPNEKLEFSFGKISWRESSVVNITDFKKLSDEFKRIIPEKKEANKDLIKEAFKIGKNVEGAEIIKKNNIQIK